MWILCRVEDSLETSSLIFSEKQWKIYMNVVCCSRDLRVNELLANSDQLLLALRLIVLLPVKQ